MTRETKTRLADEIAATLHSEPTPRPPLTPDALLALFAANPATTDAFVKEIFA